jgi:cytochrome P450
MNIPSDPFREARQEGPVFECEFQGEKLPMILRHEDVRKAARDWKTFSSDAPFRVPIPSEENVRTVRQLPVETNPPEHTEYRRIVEPFFQRAKDPAMIAQVEKLIEEKIREALESGIIEVVREMALPIQSRALAYLLNVPEEEATTWISWGTHVFREGPGEKKGAALEAYLNEQLDKAAANPGGADFFSALATASFQSRPLSRTEMLGFANLAFAGGRDTVIHTISSVLAYLAANPEALEFLRQDPSRITHACEEFFRVLTPLTHIARVCPEAANVHGALVNPGGRISICWASANQDSSAFEAPEQVRLDRKPNPHLAFGFGPHLCLGAAHARLLLRTLLQKCCGMVGALQIVEAREKIEHESRYDRAIGHELLRMKFMPVEKHA